MSTILSPLALEQELAQQLVQASSGRPRAMSASIVIAAMDAMAGHDENAALAGLLTGRRPVRIIHALPFSREEALRASTRCAVDRQSRGVCIEDIMIETLDERAIAGALWGPFVIRDLSAILFWQRPLEELARCADDCAHRVDLCLLDSDRFFPATKDKDQKTEELLRARACQLKALMEEGLCLRDLSWERLFDLRRHTARLAMDLEAADPSGKGSGAELEIRIHIPSPWPRLLFSAWLMERIEKAGRTVSISTVEELPEWSVSVLHPRSRMWMNSGPRIPDEGAIFTRLVDRPLREERWEAALGLIAAEVLPEKADNNFRSS